MQSLIHPDVGLELLSNALGGFDLSEYDLDGSLPYVPDHLGILGGLTPFRNVMSWAREERLTIRQLSTSVMPALAVSALSSVRPYRSLTT